MSGEGSSYMGAMSEPDLFVSEEDTERGGAIIDVECSVSRVREFRKGRRMEADEGWAKTRREGVKARGGRGMEGGLEGTTGEGETGGTGEGETVEGAAANRRMAVHMGATLVSVKFTFTRRESPSGSGRGAVAAANGTRLVSYLGSPMHLHVFSEDLSTFMHVHGSTTDTWMGAQDVNRHGHACPMPASMDPTVHALFVLPTPDARMTRPRRFKMFGQVRLQKGGGQEPADDKGGTKGGAKGGAPETPDSDEGDRGPLVYFGFWLDIV
jgi:hypothetical protein